MHTEQLTLWDSRQQQQQQGLKQSETMPRAFFLLSFSFFFQTDFQSLFFFSRFLQLLLLLLLLLLLYLFSQMNFKLLLYRPSRYDGVYWYFTFTFTFEESF